MCGIGSWKHKVNIYLHLVSVYKQHSLCFQYWCSDIHTTRVYFRGLLMCSLNEADGHISNKPTICLQHIPWKVVEKHNRYLNWFNTDQSCPIRMPENNLDNGICLELDSTRTMRVKTLRPALIVHNFADGIFKCISYYWFSKTKPDFLSLLSLFYAMRWCKRCQRHL